MTFLSKIKFNSINSQITIAFVTLTVLIIALQFFAYVWIRQMVVINTLKENSASLKEMQMLLKSSANEFILREKTNELFFASGKSSFLDRYAGQLVQLKEDIGKIQNGSIMNSIDAEEMKKLDTSVDLYNKVFLEMVEKLKTRGYGKYGLIGEFDKSIKNLLQYDFGIDNKAVLKLELFVKDYLLTGDENLVKNISDEIFNFTMALESHIEDAEVDKVSTILVNYETVFKQLTEVDKELGIYNGKGLQGLLFSASDDLDKTIQLKVTNEKINEAYTGNLYKLYLSFFLVVGTSMIAALIINRRLFKALVIPIQKMKSIVESMSRGEIAESVLKFKVDELDQMAKALNNLVMGTRNYQDFANNIGKGHLDVEFTPLSDQDVLGSSLIAMRNNLKSNAEEDKKRAWAAQGLAEIGMLLRSQTATNSELYNNTLQFIIKYTGSNQGSLFLLQNGDTASNESYLELVACYAWEKRKYLKKRIELGVGLAGQCALEQEVIYMTNLPKEYITIKSGLGESSPSALLIVPLKMDDQVIGVLEIASFKNYEKYQIDLITKFSDIVAAAVNVEIINKRTSVLLQQAQQQTEQLQSQEIELKRKIEELEVIQIQNKDNTRDHAVDRSKVTLQLS